MEKIFILKGLDCPNCSAKIEKEVGELAGVSSSSINLMKQSLTISVEEDALSLVTKQIETIVHRHEPDVTVTEYIAESSVSTQETKSEDYNNKIRIIRLIAGALIFISGIISNEFINVSLHVYLIFVVLAYIILGGDVVINAIKNITIG